MENAILKRKFYNNDDSGKVFLLVILFQLLVSFLLTALTTQIASSNEIPVEQIRGNIWYIIGYSILNFLINVLVYVLYNKYKKIEISD